MLLHGQNHRIILVAMSIQWNEPLTLALSPSDGERERFRQSDEQSPFRDQSWRLPIFPLSPSDGERAGVDS